MSSDLHVEFSEGTAHCEEGAAFNSPCTARCRSVPRQGRDTAQEVLDVEAETGLSGALGDPVAKLGGGDGCSDGDGVERVSLFEAGTNTEWSGLEDVTDDVGVEQVKGFTANRGWQRVGDRVR